jgi:uncharacterized repeat protein (TIGR02543 family)
VGSTGAIDPVPPLERDDPRRVPHPDRSRRSVNVPARRSSQWLAAWTVVALVLGIPAVAPGQTNPAPRAIPYSQDWSALAHSSTTYPAGWQGWRIGTAGSTFATAAPTANEAMIGSATASSTNNRVYNYNGKVGWLTGTNDLALALAINTTGASGVTVDYDAMTIRNPYNGGSNTRIGAFVLQYRVGTSGGFTNVTGTEYQNNTTTQTSGTTPQNVQARSVVLPSACDNQAVVQLRWVARDVSGAGSRPSFAIDDVQIGSGPPSFTITASAGPNGSISPSGAIQVTQGDDAAFTITPNAGYHVADVLVDGGSVGAVTGHTFTNVTANHTISASFAINTYTLTVNVAGSGSVSRNPDQPTYDHGTNVQLTAEPAAGHAFIAWSGDLSGSANPIFVPMTTDRTVGATFADNIDPAVTVLAPNGGEIWNAGTVHSITWNATDGVGVTSVDLAYSTNGGGSWTPIATGIANTGSHFWLVPNTPSIDARVRVTAHDAASNAGEDAGDASFEIRFVPATGGKIVSFRADLASGSGPYPVPGSSSPWTDISGHGHHGTLPNFFGSMSSGWVGSGTRVSPYRLEFNGEEHDGHNRVAIPAGSIPELQTIGPVSAAAWFKTSFNGAIPLRWEYVLEWVEHPTNIPDPEFEGRGMSIMVENGVIQVYMNGWVQAAPAVPDHWYHVAVVKNVNDLRVYVNGVRTYTGNHPHQGIQESELVLGCSTFRRFEGYEGEAIYGEFFGGSIAQVDVWSRTLDDSEVLAEFRADSALYLPNAPIPPAQRAVRLRADDADGTTHYPVPGAGSPWMDRAGTPTNATLLGFDGTAASGWQGTGTQGSPWRLQFDGIDDVVTIPAGAVSELQNAKAASAELWFRTGPNAGAPDYRHLFEWVTQYSGSNGIAISTAGGKLLVFFDTPFWTEIADLDPDTWYHLVVAKEPGEARVYLDGVRRYTTPRPLMGDQFSEITIGGSTWRGPGIYGEFFDGAIAQVTVWQGALTDSAAHASWQADRALYHTVYTVDVAVVGNGSVTKTPNEPFHDPGSNVQLTAIPAPGETFLGWSGDATGTTNPLDVTVNANLNITATFTAATAVGDPGSAAFDLSVSPNPSSGRARVVYALPHEAPVRLSVIDVQGRQIALLADGTRPSGVHEVKWLAAGGNVRAGVYFVRYETPGRVLVRRFLLTR